MSLYKPEYVDLISSYISSGYLTLNAGRIYFHGKQLKVYSNGTVIIKKFNGGGMYPKAALVGWLLLGKAVPEKEEIHFVNGTLVSGDNLTIKKRKAAARDHSSRAFSLETAVAVRNEYRNRLEGQVTFRTLQEKHGLSRCQITNILYHPATTPFWSEVAASAPPLDKSEKKKAFVKRKPLTFEHRKKISDASKAYHSGRIKTSIPKTKPKTEKPKIKTTLPKKKPEVMSNKTFNSLLDLIRSC